MNIYDVENTIRQISIANLNIFLTANTDCILYIGRGNKKNSSIYELTDNDDKIITIDIQSSIDPSYVMDFDKLENLCRIEKCSIKKIIFDYNVLKFFDTPNSHPFDFFSALQNLLVPGGIIYFPDPMLSNASLLDEKSEPTYNFGNYTIPEQLVKDKNDHMLRRIRKEVNPVFNWNDDYSDVVNKIIEEESEYRREIRETYYHFILKILTDMSIFRVIKIIRNEPYPYHATDHLCNVAFYCEK